MILFKEIVSNNNHLIVDIFIRTFIAAQHSDYILDKLDLKALRYSVFTMNLHDVD